MSRHFGKSVAMDFQAVDPVESMAAIGNAGLAGVAQALHTGCGPASAPSVRRAVGVSGPAKSAQR